MLQDRSGKLDLSEMDWLWCFHTISYGLSKAPLLRQEADLMLLGQEFDAMDANDENDAAKLARYGEERELAVAAIDRQTAAALIDNRLAAVQVAAFANLLVIVLFADAEWAGHHTLLQLLLTLFPFGWALEFSLLVYTRPPPQDNSREHLMRWASFSVLCAALIGSVLMAVDPDHEITVENNKQCLAGLTVFMLITRNVYFARMVLAFCSAMAAVAPVLIAILMFVMMFSLATCDIFGGKVVSAEKVPYFNSNTTSLTSLFRLFISAAWHEVVLRAAAATTEAAILWFYGYMFLISVFCSELFIGVIITQYVESTSFKSAKLAALLRPILDAGPSECDAVLTGVLTLNRNCRPYELLYAALEHQLVPLEQQPLPPKPITVLLCDEFRCTQCGKRIVDQAALEICAVCDWMGMRMSVQASPATKQHDRIEGVQSSLHRTVTELLSTILQDLGCGVLCEPQHIQSPPHFNTSIDTLWSVIHAQLVPDDDEGVGAWRERCCKALRVWLEAIVAGICSEGIWDFFSLSGNSDPMLEAHTILDRFAFFGMRSCVDLDTSGSTACNAQWQKVCLACRDFTSRAIDDCRAPPAFLGQAPQRLGRLSDQQHILLELDQVLARQSSFVTHYNRNKGGEIASNLTRFSY